MIVVDDGLATGATAIAAVESLRQRGAARVVVAIPVAAAESLVRLRRVADAVVCIVEALQLGAVGAWYVDFRPTEDAEVTGLLALARAERDPPLP